MDTSWIKDLEKGNTVIVSSYHGGDRIEAVERITPTGRIVAGGYTFNQKGVGCGLDTGVRLKQATEDNIFAALCVRDKQHAISLARDIGNQSVRITYAQARHLLLLGSTLIINRFIAPVNLYVTYAVEGEEKREIEPLYSYPLCDEYLQLVNKSIRTLPRTRYEYGGLACGIQTSNQEMSFFLYHVIDYILPSVEVRDGVLSGVFEVGCRQWLHNDAVIALKQYLEEQCFHHWGEDLLQIDIPIPDAMLFYKNGKRYLCPRREAEQEATQNLLKSPAVNIRFYNEQDSLTMEK